jgi:hypothetical protein
MNEIYPYRYEFRVRLDPVSGGKMKLRTLTVEGDTEHNARRLLWDTAREDGFWIRKVLEVTREEIS